MMIITSQYACYSMQLLGYRKWRNLRFGVVWSAGDVDNYFLYKQVNPSTELTSNSMGQLLVLLRCAIPIVSLNYTVRWIQLCFLTESTSPYRQTTSWEVASRLRSPEIPRLLAFFSVMTQTFHWSQSWDGCTLLYGLTTYFIAPILIMGYPAKYQVAPYHQIFRRYAYISHLPKCLTYPTETIPTDFTTLARIIHAAMQIQYYEIHHVIFPIHLLAPSLCPSYVQAAFSNTLNLQPHRNVTPVYLKVLLERRRNSQIESYRDFTVKSNVTYSWLPALSVLMADVAVFVSSGIKISDFDRVKFDFGREMELKKKKKETSAFHFYLRASEAGPL